MIKVSGICIHSGCTIGKIFVYNKKEYCIKKEKAENIDFEKERFFHSLKETEEQLHQLYIRTQDIIGSKNAAIFEMQKYITMDECLIQDVISYIELEKCNAEYAVSFISKKYLSAWKKKEDEKIKERSNDMIDVTDRIIKCLSGEGKSITKPKEPAIIIANDLTPMETIWMNENNVLGFVLQRGSAYSHATILAKSMNIPCLIQTKMSDIQKYDGKTGAIDGKNNFFIIEPTKEECRRLEKERISDNQYQEELKSLVGKDNITKTGKKIDIYANIERAEEVEQALMNDAGGIGLFRSEFLFLSNKYLPNEEEQFQAYKKVVRAMNPKMVIIRTIDIGADKKADCIKIEKEENPALGLRGIRLCLKEISIFKTQLRAILRASSYGKVGILIPMITSVEEIKKVKELISELQDELKEEKKNIGVINLGAMIETPASVLISDMLAKEVDFFSIGTNDLTQYTLAVDRNNIELEKYYDPYHLAVMKMLEMTVKNAHNAGIRVGICGEIAGNSKFTEQLLKMNIDEISVPCGLVLELRKRVREIE